MSLKADQQTIRLAGNIANRTALYEKAWRANDSTAMREHYLALDRLCAGNAEAEMLRAACVITAARTRGALLVTEACDRVATHLDAAPERDKLIREYVDGMQQELVAEGFLAAA